MNEAPLLSIIKLSNNLCPHEISIFLERSFVLPINPIHKSHEMNYDFPRKIKRFTVHLMKKFSTLSTLHVSIIRAVSKKNFL